MHDVWRTRMSYISQGGWVEIVTEKSKIPTLSHHQADSTLFRRFLLPGLCGSAFICPTTKSKTEEGRFPFSYRIVTFQVAGLCHRLLTASNLSCLFLLSRSPKKRHAFAARSPSLLQLIYDIRHDHPFFPISYFPSFFLKEHPLDQSLAASATFSCCRRYLVYLPYSNAGSCSSLFQTSRPSCHKDRPLW